MRCFSIGSLANKYTRGQVTFCCLIFRRTGRGKESSSVNIWYKKPLIIKSCLECSSRYCNMCRSIRLAIAKSFSKQFLRIGMMGPRWQSMLRTRSRFSHWLSLSAPGRWKTKPTCMLVASSTTCVTRRVNSSGSPTSRSIWKKAWLTWSDSCSSWNCRWVKSRSTSDWRIVCKNCSTLSSLSLQESCRRIRMRLSISHSFWKGSLTLWISVAVQNCSDCCIDFCGSTVLHSWLVDWQQQSTTS